ncbi:variant leucine-rich repeat-containing protein, partial [Georgenia subflava]
MTSPEQYSAYDASNPATAPEDLARIAEHRGDLRALVAGNPGTPPEVLRWLGSLGDVAVDSALRRRDSGGFAAPSGSPGPAGSAGSAPAAGAPWGRPVGGPP